MGCDCNFKINDNKDKEQKKHIYQGTQNEGLINRSNFHHLLTIRRNLYKEEMLHAC
jgi:hypothetical protein